MNTALITWLETAGVDPVVHELRPDYRALIVVAEALCPGPPDAWSERLLEAAEDRARRTFGDGPIERHPNLAAWRDAFKGFGAKPQRTRPSVEALLRRVPEGLPRVDRLTDAYNAVSIAHLLPVGGEDLDRYDGPLRLTLATGDEPFDTSANGQAVIEYPEAGEVVWRDDRGVTCRRWNWRQCVRTRLTTTTTRAVFVLDALAPMTDGELAAAGDALADTLAEGNPGARLARRLIAQSPP